MYKKLLKYVQVIQSHFDVFVFENYRELGAALPSAETQNSMFGETANHHHVLFHPPLMNHPTHDQHSQMRLGSSFLSLLLYRNNIFYSFLCFIFAYIHIKVPFKDLFSNKVFIIAEEMKLNGL